MILLAMSRWQPIASIVTTAPSIDIMSSSTGMAAISLDFSFTLTWPTTMRCRREGGDYVDRLFRALALIGAPRSLAVDRHGLGRRVGQGRDPGHEASLERAGVEGGKDIAEMVMRGRAVYIGPEPPQQFNLPLAKPGDF